ncbi:N-acetylmuramoyl-L-alanine amidase family protein [Mangrovimonas cancribranchiae]|uniref:N-acetylmuramoyl-L-alanine amidase n=1 Tax=Mangrovimonas cancribranchiae TaxID=3080055 RepID=A0AAU6NZF9_9FLAO
MKTYNKFLLVLTVVILTFFYNTSSLAQTKTDKFVVVLDAGHGGKDPGRPTSYGWKEKDIALDVVLKVGKAVESNPNFEVIYTRKTDVFLELHERASIANKADADLFISIHCNAHNSQAYGTETYVLGVGNTERNFNVAKAENEVIYLEDNYEKHYEGFDPNSPDSFIGLTLMQEEYVEQSIMLANFIETNFKKDLKRKSRGVKQISLLVLRATYMPSVLIETGFITNHSEGKYLNSKKGQGEISNAIVKAILNYKKTLDMNVGDTVLIGGNTENNNSNVGTEDIYNNIVFKVQIAASSKKLEPKPYNFKGLDDVSREKINGLYKYYYGYTSNYTKVKQQQQTAKSKGYNSSFIVAFKDGQQITLEEALNSKAN